MEKTTHGLTAEQLAEIRDEQAEYANGVDVPAWDLAASCEMLLAEVDRLGAKVARVTALAEAMSSAGQPRPDDTIGQAYARSKRLGNAETLLVALSDQPGDEQPPIR